MTTLSAHVFVAQVAQYLGANGTERALKEFNNARDSLIWIRDFFQNQLHSFLIDDVHMLKKWNPKDEIHQPQYAPSQVLMTPTLTVGVNAIVATLDVRVCTCVRTFSVCTEFVTKALLYNSTQSINTRQQINVWSRLINCLFTSTRAHATSA